MEEKPENCKYFGEIVRILLEFSVFKLVKSKSSVLNSKFNGWVLQISAFKSKFSSSQVIFGFSSFILVIFIIILFLLKCFMV